MQRHGSENTHIDFRVLRERVLQALQWLRASNSSYKDITIDHDALQLLPEYGVPPELLSIDEDEEECSMPSDNGDDSTSFLPLSINEDEEECSTPSDNGNNSTSFLPLPSRQNPEDRAALNALVDWPDIARQPINELHTLLIWQPCHFPLSSHVVQVTLHTPDVHVKCH